MLKKIINLYVLIVLRNVHVAAVNQSKEDILNCNIFNLIQNLTN